jgi:hypothetical protein
MNRKKITCFAFVALLIGSAVTVVASNHDDDVSHVDLSSSISEHYEQVTEQQLSADIIAIDSEPVVKYSMLGC